MVSVAEYPSPHQIYSMFTLAMDPTSPISVDELPSETQRLQTIQLSDRYTLLRYEDDDISLLTSDGLDGFVISRPGLTRLSGLLRVLDLDSEDPVDGLPSRFRAVLETGLTLANDTAHPITFHIESSSIKLRHDDIEHTFTQAEADGLKTCLDRWRYYSIPSNRIEFTDEIQVSEYPGVVSVPAINPQ